MTEEMVIVKKQFLMDQLEQQLRLWMTVVSNDLATPLYFYDIVGAYTTVLSQEDILKISAAAMPLPTKPWGM